MIALLNSEEEAIALSNDIHAYLLENRKDYNALKWNELNKSNSENVWAVKIPADYSYDGNTVDKMPENWNEVEQS